MKKNGKKDKRLGGDAFKQELLKDDTFKKYRQIVRNIKNRQDLDELSAEALRLHSGRISRTLYGTNPGPLQLQNASLQDGSHRSRLTEIKFKLSEDIDRLDLALDAARIHLAQTYSEEMPPLKTKDERKTYFDRYLGAGLKLHAGLKGLSNRLDLLIKDLDQAGFTIKHCIDVMALVYDKRSQNI